MASAGGGDRRNQPSASQSKRKAELDIHADIEKQYREAIRLRDAARARSTATPRRFVRPRRELANRESACRSFQLSAPRGTGYGHEHAQHLTAQRVRIQGEHLEHSSLVQALQDMSISSSSSAADAARETELQWDSFTNVRAVDWTTYWRGQERYQPTQTGGAQYRSAVNRGIYRPGIGRNQNVDSPHLQHLLPRLEEEEED